MNDTKMNSKQNTLIGYISMFICSFLLFVFSIQGTFSAFILPFKSFEPFRGNLSSPFVGLKNFRMLNNQFFTSALTNTIIISLFSLLISSLIGMFLAHIVANISNKKIQNTVATLIFSVFIIPILCFTIFVPTNLESVKIYVILINSIKLTPISFIICYYSIKNNKTMFFGIMIFILLNIPFYFNINLEYVYTMQNASNVLDIEILNSYIFREGFNRSNFSSAASIELIKSIWKFISFTIVLPVLYLLLKGKTFDLGSYKPNKKNILVSVIIFALGFFISLLLILTNSSPSFGLLDFIANTFICLFNMLIFTLLSFIFVIPLIYGNKITKIIYSSFLILSLSFGGNIIIQYLQNKNLGLLNTYLPLLLNNVLNIPFILLVGFITINDYNVNNGYKKLLLCLLRPLTACAVLQFCLNWGNYYKAIIYIFEARKYTLPLLIVNSLKDEVLNINFSLIILLAIVPITLFLVFRRCFISYKN